MALMKSTSPSSSTRLLVRKPPTPTANRTKTKSTSPRASTKHLLKSLTTLTLPRIRKEKPLLKCPRWLLAILSRLKSQPQLSSKSPLWLKNLSLLRLNLPHFLKLTRISSLCCRRSEKLLVARLTLELLRRMTASQRSSQ